jgi:hypothetical protein
VWRDGKRQSTLARALDGVNVWSLDGMLARQAGELLAASGHSDVIDAALVLLAADGDEIVTSDSADIQPLALTAGRLVELIRP